MYQTFKVRGYRVPFSQNGDKKAIFSSVNKRDQFLLNLWTGYEHTYARPNVSTAQGLDFDPRQEKLIIPLRSNAAYDAAADSEVMRINYVRVDLILSPTQYQSYFYFVNASRVLPAYGWANQGNTGGHIAYDNRLVAELEIELDPWATWLPPNVPAAIMSRWTVITQSTRGIAGMAASEFDAALPFSTRDAGANASPDGRALVYKAVDRAGRFASRTLGARPVVSQVTFFVGVFAREGGGAPLLLCRPYDVTKEPTDASFLPLDALTTIKEIAPATDITAQYVINRDVSVGTPFNVNLVRAFLIPKRCFQTDDAEEGRQHAYAITKTDVTDGQQPAGLTAIQPDKIVSFQTAIKFDPAQVVSGVTIEDVGTVSFVDVGTLYTRLEIPAPTAGGAGLTTIVFNGQVSASGYTLVMTCGGRQVDLGGDFEIPVPVNPQLDALTRNKWSQALQGVAAVGGLAVGLASKSAPSILGGALSLGNYIAGTAEKASAVGVIQGQGNGVMLNSMNEYSIDTTTDGETLGFVYARYEFRNNLETALMSRYGFVWNGGAYVDAPKTFGDVVFLNDGATPTLERIYIKTIAADINLSDSADLSAWGLTKYGASLYAGAKEKIEETFNRGVTIYYDPLVSSGGNPAGEGYFGN